MNHLATAVVGLVLAHAAAAAAAPAPVVFFDIAASELAKQAGLGSPMTAMD